MICGLFFYTAVETRHGASLQYGNNRVPAVAINIINVILENVGFLSDNIKKKRKGTSNYFSLTNSFL